MSTLTPQQIAALQANDHDDKRAAYIAGNAVCLVAALVAVALRFTSRRIARAKIGIDDWLILVAWLLTAIYASLLFSLTHYGMGRHAWWITNVEVFSQLSITSETMYNVAIPVIKISILYLYRRIFPQPWFNRALIVLGGFIVAYSLAQIFADIFQCVPISSLWGATAPEFCINYPALIISMGVVNTVTDIIMLSLPMPLLWKLQLSTMRKRLLTGLFLMGGFVCIVSIVRLFYVNKVGNTKDASWDYVLPSTLSGLECSVGIISACLPTYRPLVTSAFPTKRAGVRDQTHTSQAAKSYGQDSLNVPLRSLFTQKSTASASASASGSVSHYEDEEQLFPAKIPK